jgi:hypothetical protein
MSPQASEASQAKIIDIKEFEGRKVDEHSFENRCPEV